LRRTAPQWSSRSSTASRLRADGTTARLLSYPTATHTFLTIPTLVPAARRARREILDFLRNHLHSSR
jgi:Esterase/lipase